jgi:hypothetical protein
VLEGNEDSPMPPFNRQMEGKKMPTMRTAIATANRNTSNTARLKARSPKLL